MPKVSVIIPVYNVECYLHKCVDSVLMQTYEDFELLLIDDGSLDDSGRICDEYAIKDQRVHVLHKENSGVSSARNVGIDMSQGEWITFVDADDWLDINLLNTCLPFTDDYDIIRFTMSRVMKEDGSDNRPYHIVDESKEKYLSRILSRDTILGVCGGLYRRDLFIQNNIRFDTSLVSGEDWVVLTDIVVHANKCKILNYPLYQYNRYNEKSCTSVFRFETQLSNLYAMMKVSTIIYDCAGLNITPKSKYRGKCALIYNFMTSTIGKNVQLSKSEWRQYDKIAKLKFFEFVYGYHGIKQFILLLYYMVKVKLLRHFMQIGKIFKF